MEHKHIEFKKSIVVDMYQQFILCGDVGGTNTNLAIAGVSGEIIDLIFAMNYKSQKINGLDSAVNHILKFAKEAYGVDVVLACIGGAGPVNEKNELCKLTHAKWDIDAKKIVKNTKLKKVVVLNDFQLIGYAINYLEMKMKKDILVVKSGKKVKEAVKVVVGPGTGLGKGILVYDSNKKMYDALPSEGGHSDFPANNLFEIEMVESTKKRLKLKTVGYEHFVSAGGIVNIYNFLREQMVFDNSKYSNEVDNSDDMPQAILKFRKKDDACKEAYSLFAKYLARCAKNFALETMALGGVYLVGSIVPYNKDVIDKGFVNEFNGQEEQNEVVKQIPVYMINVNDFSVYQISLYGAAYYASKMID